MLALIWVAFLSPLAGEIGHQGNKFREAKGRTFAQTQEEFGMVSADEHYAAGHNACLDELARLNRNTVPLELLERATNWDKPTAMSIAQSKIRAVLAGAKP